VAAAQPQYGRGTRIIPATNLDVIVVLDYSKSMHARDVKPSRIARAKTEVAQLISELPGARFGAVAFAGEPLAFPMTSDGGAVAQFFRQLSPNDMPVGGTALARALEAGRELFARDPLSRTHKKVIVLVTDGEDLEGDPVSVAQSCARDEVTIHVVQIGGRTPEPLPEVDLSGEVIGWRKDQDGKPITTQLTAAGEAQLAKIAESTGGNVVRSEHGSTGLRAITTALRKMMTGELGERVETVYADVYAWPLAIALCLLVVETFVPESPRRQKRSEVPLPARERRGTRRKKSAWAAAATGLSCAALWTGCQGGVDEVFSRNAPAVDEAILALDAGDAQAAVSLLAEYLATGKCENGQIGVNDHLRQRANASFDLGLGLFEIAETFGKRFGDEELGVDGGLTPLEEQALCERSAQVDCALKITELTALDPQVSLDLRARAHYLAGNLEFLRRNYRAAVAHYDRSLKLTPGLADDAGDPIGRDTAWNRAIALRRIQDEEDRKDASHEPEPDSSDAHEETQPEGGPDAAEPDGSDGGQDGGGGPDGGQDGGRDAGDDGSSQSSDPDGGKDASEDTGAGPRDQPDAGAPPEQQESPTVNQDERMLDMLERAPTLQQQAARNKALQRQVRSGMEDK
jgi:Ca-activated chloride channel family protein